MGNSRRALGCLVAVSALGCATIINGPTQTVEITSNPPGAKVTVLPSGQHLVTPGKAELRRRLVHTVLFELDGYQPATAYLDRTNSQVTLGNILIGGLIGLAVDQSTGAVYRLIPDPLHVDLVPAESPQTAGE
jgi:hypothetical protein